MSSKHASYSSISQIGRNTPLMERDPVMDAPSIDEMPEDYLDRKSECSSPGSGVASFESSTMCTPLRDVWLGQKYLESAIALRLHLHADPEDVNPILESKLKANLEDFPFRQCCTFLQNEDANVNLNPGSKGTNPRNVLLSWIGHAIHEEMEAEAALFSRAITLFVNTTPLVSTPIPDESPHVQSKWSRARNGSPQATNGDSVPIRPRDQARQPAGSSSQSEHLPTQNGSTPRRNGSPIVQNAPPVRPNGTLPEQNEMAKYINHLLNRGVYLNERPVWVESDIGTLEAPCFRCVVTFQGRTAEGTGRQKRFAKNEATYRICQVLGINSS